MQPALRLHARLASWRFTYHEPQQGHWARMSRLDSCRRRCLASVVLWAVFGSISPGWAEVPHDTRASRRIVSPVYGRESSTPIAVVRVESTRTEYQRRGFLRIGALPFLVAERVRIEVREPAAIQQLWAALPEWLRAPGKGRSVEIRGFELHGQEVQRGPWLKAARVRVAERGQWDLTEGSFEAAQGGQVVFANARLQITGDQSGRITLPDGRNLMLFAVENEHQPRPAAQHLLNTSAPEKAPTFPSSSSAANSHKRQAP